MLATGAPLRHIAAPHDVKGTRMRTLAIGSAAIGLLAVGLATASPASALDTAEYDAPLLGTTATAQATRLPSLAEVQCSDAACTTGLFPKTSLSYVEYSTDSFIREAGYTQVPEFRRGVYTVWQDRTKDDDASSFASFVIAEYAPGSDMRKVAEATAALTGTPLSERQVDGTTVLVGQVVNDNDDDNIYTGTAFRSAIVLGTDSMVRAGCQMGGTSVEKSRCTVDGLARIAVAIAARQPAAPADAAALGALPPRSLPSGLDAVVTVSASAGNPWNDPDLGKAVRAALAGKPTAISQYALAGMPDVYVSTTASPLAKGLARKFATRSCDVPDGYTCAKRSLAGGSATQLTITKQGTKGAKDTVISVTVAGAGRGVAIEAGCSKRVPISGPFTARELSRCVAVSKSIVTAAIR